jgi:hypothetical protein
VPGLKQPQIPQIGNVMYNLVVIYQRTDAARPTKRLNTLVICGICGFNNRLDDRNGIQLTAPQL